MTSKPAKIKSLAKHRANSHIIYEVQMFNGNVKKEYNRICYRSSSLGLVTENLFITHIRLLNSESFSKYFFRVTAVIRADNGYSSVWGMPRMKYASKYISESAVLIKLTNPLRRGLSPTDNYYLTNWSDARMNLLTPG
jgi:hypothetical protein